MATRRLVVVFEIGPTFLYNFRAGRIRPRFAQRTDTDGIHLRQAPLCLFHEDYSGWFGEDSTKKRWQGGVALESLRKRQT